MLANKIEQLKHKFLPRFAAWLIHKQSYRARTILSKHKPLRILLDNNILAYATTHRTAWVDLGQGDWNGIKINQGFSARVNVYHEGTSKDIFNSVLYLPMIEYLTTSGYMKLYQSGELYAERFHQPIGRFRGYGYYDHNIFEGHRFDIVDTLQFPIMGPRSFQLKTSREQQIERVNKSRLYNLDFENLVAALGEKNSLDAWHIWTAEKHQINCFLTMDFKLIRTIKSQQNNPAVRALKIKVQSPEMLASEFRLERIYPWLLSYNNASFPVRNDLVWPDR